MPIHSHARSAHRHTARVASLPSPRQAALTRRIIEALVGLTIVVAGVLAAQNAHAATTASAPAASASSAKLGTVQSVQAVQVKGKGSGAGVVAGAVLGGLVGNQMGKGTGNTVMTVGGAVAGGFAGNEVEKNVNKHTVYKTVVKMDDGSTHTYTIGQAFAIGARVSASGKKLKLAP
jgi:outer membrane lipoprotein SlyB